MAETQDLTASKLFSVKGYVCVITGGGECRNHKCLTQVTMLTSLLGSGIGLMAAQTLAANGAKVYITGRRSEVLDKAAKWHDPNGSGAIIAARTCDVTKKEEIQALVDEISAKEKQVDLLLVAAGISGPKVEPDEEAASDLKAKLWDEKVEEWDSTMRTDVTAVFFTTVAFLPLLQAASEKRGHLSASVIVVSSMSGIMRHAQGHFSYNAAKGGTVHLTKLMSAEFQKTGVRINSIAPGYFPSEMTTDDSNEKQKSHLPDEKIKEKGHVPAGRAGRDEDMAMAVIFLTRNFYVNGEILAVDGGVLNEIAGR